MIMTQFNAHEMSLYGFIITLIKFNAKHASEKTKGGLKMQKKIFLNSITALLVTLFFTACDDQATATETVAETNVTISGTVTYDLISVNSNHVGLNYDAITKAPSKGVLVEAINGSNQVIGTTSTNENGLYSIGDIPKSTDVKIRVSARLVKTDGTPSWDFKVVDNTNSNALYVMEGSLVSSDANMTQTRNLNASSGWDGTSYSATRTAAPFAILGSVYEAINKIKIAQPNAVFDPLLINWSVNNIGASGDLTLGQIGTSHYNGTALYILGKVDSDTDEYDNHVIVHEWGHYYEAKFSRSDNIGGAHSGDERLDIRVAFGEGFANAFSGMTLNDPVYFDTLSTSQADGWSMNLENDSPVNAGWYSESSVQRILYDIYDSSDDGDDSLSLGFTPIHNLFIGAQKTTPAFTSIFTFVKGLKEAQSGNATKIDAIVSSEEIAQITDLYGEGRTNLAEESPYSSTTVDGGAVNVCVNNTYGVSNKLSNHKYIKFTADNGGSYTIEATQTGGNGAQAVIELYKTSPFQSMGSNYDSYTETLTSGAYIIDISDDKSGNSCFDVTITQ